MRRQSRPDEASSFEQAAFNDARRTAVGRGFSHEMQDALRADAAKLSAMTGEEHTVEFFSYEDDLEPLEPGPRLTIDQVRNVANGTHLAVKWSGGNGPHEYRVTWDDAGDLLACSLCLPNLPDGYPGTIMNRADKHLIHEVYSVLPLER